MANIRFIKDYGHRGEGEEWEGCPDHVAAKLCEQPPYFAIYTDRVPADYKALQAMAKAYGVPANQSAEALSATLSEAIQ